MKAFISKIINGKQTLGTLNNTVSSEYKTLNNLIRYSIKQVGRYRIEGFYNWDNRYSKPDIDIIINK